MLPLLIRVCDSQTHAPPAKRPKQGKGKGGKQPDKPQVPLTDVPTRPSKLQLSYLAARAIGP